MRQSIAFVFLGPAFFIYQLTVLSVLLKGYDFSFLYIL